MRPVGIVLCLVGCSGAPAPIMATPYGLILRVSLAQSLPIGIDLSVSSLNLHLIKLKAVSDRTATDPRAEVTVADAALGATDDVPMPSAPPGTYSTVEWTLGDAAIAGLDLQGVTASQQLHAQLVGGPFDTHCANPQLLTPGQRVQLTLSADATPLVRRRGPELRGRRSGRQSDWNNLGGQRAARDSASAKRACFVSARMRALVGLCLTLATGSRRERSTTPATYAVCNSSCNTGRC